MIQDRDSDARQRRFGDDRNRRFVLTKVIHYIKRPYYLQNVELARQ